MSNMNDNESSIVIRNNNQQWLVSGYEWLVMIVWWLVYIDGKYMFRLQFNIGWWWLMMVETEWLAMVNVMVWRRSTMVCDELWWSIIVDDGGCWWCPPWLIYQLGPFDPGLVVYTMITKYVTSYHIISYHNKVDSTGSGPALPKKTKHDYNHFLIRL